MSYGKFAPITSGLLARKGEAGPSLGAKRSVTWTSELPAIHEPVRDIPHSVAHIADTIPHEAPASHELTATSGKPALAPGEKPRRIVVSFNHCEFERLGIAAVKKSTTPHNLVRDTMNEFLQRLAEELDNRCACLNGGSPCCGGQGHTG